MVTKWIYLYTQTELLLLATGVGNQFRNNGGLHLIINRGSTIQAVLSIHAQWQQLSAAWENGCLLIFLRSVVNAVSFIFRLKRSLYKRLILISTTDL
jgi:hypothetical protein